MTTENEEAMQSFIRAVRANNYAHVELREDMALVTDYHAGEKFSPYITLESNDIEKSDIEEELSEVNCIEYESIKIETQEGVNIDYGELEGVKFVDPSDHV